MADEMTAVPPAIYQLYDPGIEIAYSPTEQVVDVSGDLVLEREKLPAEVSFVPDIGHTVTATVLESSRNGTRVTLCLTVPAVMYSSNEPLPVTGAAVIASSFLEVIDGPPAVRHAYEVRQLEGTIVGRSSSPG